jgi:phage terminase large subunit-like protein
MTNDNTFKGEVFGVGIAGIAAMSWTHRVPRGMSPAAIAHAAIPQRKRHAAAARVASVNRGST